MTKFYVYTYFDPRTDLPFYVGKGQNYRAQKHLHQTTNLGMARRLAALKAEGLTPEINRYYTETEAEAFELERLLIAIYGRLVDRSGHLVNILEAGGRTGGFRGHRHSEESKQRIREALQARRLTPEHKAKIGLANKGRPGPTLKVQAKITATMRTPELRAKMSAIQKRRLIK